MSMVRLGIYVAGPLAGALVIRRSFCSAAGGSSEVIVCLAASFHIRCARFCYIRSGELPLHAKKQRDKEY